jgi:hypothetical protein
MSTSFTSEEILQQLDDCAREFTFPMLDNGYVYPGTVRLSAYRDEARWALVIEAVGYHPRAGGHDGINNCLHCFGNCLKRAPGTANEDFLFPTSDGPEGPTFDDDYGWYVRPEARSISIRGHVLPIRVQPSDLAANGIEPVEPPQVTGADLLRSLLPEYRELLLATEAELRERIPPDLPRILQLEEWHHPDLGGDEMPSQSPTFQMIAQVLETGDVDRYRPVEEPNTHWKFWPDGGIL